MTLWEVNADIDEIYAAWNALRYMDISKAEREEFANICELLTYRNAGTLLSEEQVWLARELIYHDDHGDIQ